MVVWTQIAYNNITYPLWSFWGIIQLISSFQESQTRVTKRGLDKLQIFMQLKWKYVSYVQQDEPGKQVYEDSE